MSDTLNTSVGTVKVVITPPTKPTKPEKHFPETKKNSFENWLNEFLDFNQKK